MAEALHGAYHYQWQRLCSADKNKTEDIPIGVIAIDSIYTPVERVNLLIEKPVLVRLQTMKLALDVYTNGTLEPDRAVSLAAKVLSERFHRSFEAAHD